MTGCSISSGQGKHLKILTVQDKLLCLGQELYGIMHTHAESCMVPTELLVNIFLELSGLAGSYLCPQSSLVHVVQPWRLFLSFAILAVFDEHARCVKYHYSACLQY
jgi:hypothetical protein